jgi:UDPglucose 6-dehydrogenase
MKIAIIGAGYVGTTTSVAFADSGHDVQVAEKNQDILNKLRQSTLPFYEKGLKELLQTYIKKGTLSFKSDIKEAINSSNLIFITVGTPSLEDGSANLSYVEEVAREIGKVMDSYKGIVIKSTVPVGTGEKIEDIIQEKLKERNCSFSFDLISNPEFLREGKALQDARNPDRIIVGCKTQRARDLMTKVYQDSQAPLLFTTIRESEMIKYASNAFLATKISFINELARLCDQFGANVDQVAKGMGMDHRIGPEFLRAGIGFGGSCFPKDIKALIAMAQEKNTALPLLQAVSMTNQIQIVWFLNKVQQKLGLLSGKRIAVLGLTFKPDTDDIREAISLKLVEALLANQAIVSVYDPMGMPQVKERFPSVFYGSTPMDALKDADAILIVTEWIEIIGIDWKEAKTHVNQPFVFDGRNVLDAAKMQTLGYYYEGVGTGGHPRESGK